MQSLQYAPSGSQTIAVWPDTEASSVTNSFRMVLSSDYSKASTTVDLTLQNTPTRVIPRLVFSLNKSELPSYTGNYTITIQEAPATEVKNFIWGQTDSSWSGIQARWSDQTYTGAGTYVDIDEDRAWVSGSDVPSFTQYTSPDETGAYSIYQG